MRDEGVLEKNGGVGIRWGCVLTLSSLEMPSKCSCLFKYGAVPPPGTSLMRVVGVIHSIRFVS